MESTISHVVTCDLQIKDIDIFEQCCKSQGWKFNRGKTEYKYAGYWADDSPVPGLLFDSEQEYQRVLSLSHQDRKTYMETLLGKCSHSITIPGCRHEVGLIKKKDHYVPIWDWWDSQLKMVLGTGESFPVAQQYATEVVKKTLTQQGLSWSFEQDNKGNTIIQTY